MKRPTSFLTGSALVVTSAVSHSWLPLAEVPIEMTQAYDACISNGNYELAAYVFCLDLAAQAFSTASPPWDVIGKRFTTIAPYLSPAGRFLTTAPLQYSENLVSPGSKPWVLVGFFQSADELQAITALPWHACLCYTLSLRLAVLFDAPLDEQLRIVEAGATFADAGQGTVYGVEWDFFAAVIALRSGAKSGKATVDKAHDALRIFTKCEWTTSIVQD